MPRALFTRVMLAAATVALVLPTGELWARWAWRELPPVPVLPEAYADLPKLTENLRAYSTEPAGCSQRGASRDEPLRGQKR